MSRAYACTLRSRRRWVVGSGRVWVGGAVVRTGGADMVQARGGLGREEGVGGW